MLRFGSIVINLFIIAVIAAYLIKYPDIFDIIPKNEEFNITNILLNNVGETGIFLWALLMSNYLGFSSLDWLGIVSITILGFLMFITIDASSYA